MCGGMVGRLVTGGFAGLVSPLTFDSSDDKDP